MHEGTLGLIVSYSYPAGIERSVEMRNSEESWKSRVSGASGRVDLGSKPADWRLGWSRD